MGCVYCATNEINGKKYIGKTISIMIDRRIIHENAAVSGSEEAFRRALRKHGKENFEWEILFESSSNKTLCRVEIMEIKDQNTGTPNGYNMTDGGEGLVGLIFTDKHKSNLSKALKGRRIPKNVIQKGVLTRKINGKPSGMKGKKHSSETRRKISQSNMSRESPMKGKKHSEESKKKTSESHKGKIKTSEHLKHISEALTGRKLSKAHILAIKNAERPSQTPESNLKRSLATKGKPHKCGICGILGHNRKTCVQGE